MSTAMQVSEAAARRLSRAMPDEQLVAWATELAGGIVKHLGLNKEDAQIKSQISRAAEGALQSPAVTLFSAWVRYQYGRETGSLLWHTRTTLEQTSTDVAHAVLQIVERIRKQLAAGGETEPRLVERATMLATARFLAFLRRAVIAERGWRAAP